MFADTHTHLLDGRFDSQRQDIINSFADFGISFVIENGTNVQDSLLAAKLAEKNKRVYAAIGVHPESAVDFDCNSERYLSSYAKNYSKVVAIGEIGLDYHYEDGAPRDIQRKVFEKQLDLAAKLNLPVVVHSRDATQDTYDILKNSHTIGELHCFSGSVEMAEKYLQLGFYISFGGAITFKNAGKILNVVKAVPLNRILTETDCPYMAPEPYRGKMNVPLYARQVINKIAEIKQTEVCEIENTTLMNAKKLFSIEGRS